MAMARSVGDQRAQMALMALVVGRSRGLLQALLGRRWTCGGPNTSSVMILSVDAAMMEMVGWPAGVRTALVVGRSQELLQAAPGRRI